MGGENQEWVEQRAKSRIREWAQEDEKTAESWENRELREGPHVGCAFMARGQALGMLAMSDQLWADHE